MTTRDWDIMITPTSRHSLAAQLSYDIGSRDACRVARSIGGFVAGDQYLRDAIQRALDLDSDPAAVLGAVANMLASRGAEGRADDSAAEQSHRVARGEPSLLEGTP